MRLDISLAGYLLLFALLWAAIAAPVQARQQNAGQRILGEHTDVERLLEISSREGAAFREASASLDSLIAAKGGARIFVDSTGAVREWLGIRNGRPLLKLTHNREAAASARVTPLLAGGTSGLDLSGSGQVIGLWDAGNPLPTHVELVGRVMNVDTFSLVQTHATHVAGTLVASGDWLEARGMAPEALIEGHDWNDDVAEMARSAAMGLLVSNHSYGDPLGWTPNIRGNGLWGWMGDPSVSPREDIRFGLYGAQAAAWDDIAHAGAHLVIVKSAGNERDRQGPLDGAPHYVYDQGWVLSDAVRGADGGGDGYDTIGDTGVAKNVLTVGAVDDAPWGVEVPGDVVMTSFSGWGPVDDGRIKPDLVANGTELLSAKAGSDTDYGTSSGTSMAAPVVAGSVALLQELYQREFPGFIPLSSTIRGLLVHSADEAGEFPGPDYRFGWGQLNAERAALHLRQHAISEKSLAPTRPYPVWMLENEVTAGGSFEIEIPVQEEGIFRVTMAWTDPAGDERPNQLNSRTANLVHDLDIEVVDGSGTHLPWVLDPDQPFAAASTGINDRDNIEQVVFVAAPGIVRVRVKAPVSLQTASQAFSLLIGTPDAAEAPGAMHAVSGTVRLGTLGISGLNVRLEGPVVRGSRTNNDGIFYIDDLPSGSYQLSVDPSLFSFSPERITVDLPSGQRRFDLEVIPPLQPQRVRTFQSDLLLQSGEQSLAVDVSDVSAGGLYGVELFFSSSQAQTVAGATVSIDTRFDPFVSPWTGTDAATFEELSLSQTLAVDEGSTLKKRIPVIWISGHAPGGNTVRIPYEIRLGGVTGQLLLADTLSWTVRGSDRTGPFPLASLRKAGASFAFPGGSMEIRSSFLDGSEVVAVEAVMVDRFDESMVLARIPMRDTGDLSNDLDYVAGDGIFTGRFYPIIQAEYRLILEAEDEVGNKTRQAMPAYYSSASFSADGDLLFLAEQEASSRTNKNLALLADLGYSASWWETQVRGPMPDADVSHFDWIIAGRHAAPLNSETDISVLANHLGRGGKLHLFAQKPTSSQIAETWLQETVGIETGATARVDSIDGVGPLEGLHMFLGSLSQPRFLTLPPDGEPLLKQGNGILAARVGNVVVSTVSMSSFDKEADSELIMRAFLFEESGDTSFIPAPDTVQVFTSPLVRISGDEAFVSWQRQQWAEFEIEVATDSLFADVFLSQAVRATKFRITGMQRGARYHWRVRAVNPTGVSEWSDRRVVVTPPANKGPFRLTDGGTLELGEGGAVVYLGYSVHFADPENDRMIYSAEVVPAGIVRTELQTFGVVIYPEEPGVARLTFTATDPDGLSDQIEFDVVVVSNTAPTAPGLPANPQYMRPGTEQNWPITDVFDEPDGDSLRFWIFNGDPSVAEASIIDQTLHFAAHKTGTGFVSIRASDGRGASIEQSLHIRVRENTAPELTDLFQGPEFFPGEAASFWLKNHFFDQDEDDLTYELLSSSDNVTDVSIRNDSLFATMGDVGNASFDIRVTDVFGESSDLTLEIAVRLDAVIRVEDSRVPIRFSVLPTYPQPFTRRATIPFTIPVRSHVILDVFDSLGRHQARIIDRRLEPGKHRIDWIPRDLPAGNYYYTLRAGDERGHGVLVFVR